VSQDREIRVDYTQWT